VSNRNPYPSDVTDDAWAVLEPLIPASRSGPNGGPPAIARREIFNGIRYVVRSGSAWRLMPHDLPNWATCYHYFRIWKNDGTWQRTHDKLRGDVREAAGRNREPSAAIIDSQSVETTEKGGFTATTRAKRSMAESAIFS
jgi:transposase